MDKAALVSLLLETLRDEFAQRSRASRLTRAAGNDAEARAESKYDTLSIEENYLADGLARHAQAAALAAAAIEKMPLRAFSPNDPIDLGALVELAFPDGREWFFLAPAAGGSEIVHEGQTITVLTPESPLGAKLIGRQAGDRLDAPRATIQSVQ